MPGFSYLPSVRFWPLAASKFLIFQRSERPLWVKADIRRVISVRQPGRVVKVRLVHGRPMRLIFASVIARRRVSGVRSGTSHPGSGGNRGSKPLGSANIINKLGQHPFAVVLI